jgi:hypothetical protein
MNDQHENIDKVFQEKLFNHSEVPPEIVWKKIAGDLRQEKKKMLVPVYLKVAAVLVLAAGLGGVIWELKNNPASPLIVSTSVVKNTSASIANSENIGTKSSAKTKFVNSKLQNNSAGSKKPGTLKISDTEEIISVEIKSVPPTLREDIKSDTLQNGISRENIALTDSGTNPAVINTQDSTLREIAAVNSAKKPATTVLDVFLAENLPETHKSLKWLIGAQAGPQYSYRYINSDQKTTNVYNSIESPVLAYAGGLQIQLEAAKRLSVQTGIYYSKIGVERTLSYNADASTSDFISIDASKLHNLNQTRGAGVDVYMNSNGSITYTYREQTNSWGDGPSPSNTEGISNGPQVDYHAEQFCEYMEIPLVLRYRFLSYKLKLNLVGGISSNILIGNSVHETGPNNFNISGPVAGVNKFNYNGSLGLGVEYPLSRKIVFNLEPIFKYYFSSMSESSGVDVHPYSLGIMTGINYKF